MSTEKSEKTLSVAKDFARAAMNKQDDLAFENRLVDAAEKNGWDPMDFMETAMEFAMMKQQLGAAADKDPKYRETAIKLSEVVAKMYVAFCSDEELKDMLPAAANDTQVQEELASEGAPTLSKLCARLG